jgi:hypothetical protein
MPQPHPFAAAAASKDRTQAGPKSSVTVYGYARVSTGGQDRGETAGLAIALRSSRGAGRTGTARGALGCEVP